MIHSVKITPGTTPNPKFLTFFKNKSQTSEFVNQNTGKVVDTPGWLLKPYGAMKLHGVPWFNIRCL